MNVTELPAKAAIMMDLLLPVGWGDIVTKAELRSELARLEGELLTKLFFEMVASNATLVGLVFAAVRLG
ncbi:hypothetical protein [Actinospongicola halichondriae]|uniref:hypothetical protein n=1 Tax=Actinospongicola halichondriae TaxID=3236844 RepID=UPI003D4C6625